MALVPLQAMPLPLGALLGALGLALLGLGVRDLVAGLRYRTDRPVPVGRLSADADRVVVSGVARRAEEALSAPLSGRACLAYAWRVAELRTMRRFDGEIDTWGQRGESGRDAVPFFVEDETGRVLVDPAGADLRLAEEWIRDPAADPTDRVGAPTPLDVLDDLSGVSSHDRRFYESRLDEGETVTVRGRVGPDAGRLDARAVGVSIGGGPLVEDATPGAAAGRALRSGAVSAAAGLFVLAAVAVFVVVPLL